jgi:hypothetical protein
MPLDVIGENFCFLLKNGKTVFGELPQTVVVKFLYRLRALIFCYGQNADFFSRKSMFRRAFTGSFQDLTVLVET